MKKTRMRRFPIHRSSLPSETLPGSALGTPAYMSPERATRDEARTFADQSVAAIVDVVEAGSALPSELKEPEFDAVRGRDDFRKLVADVAAKAGPRAKLRD